MEVVFATTKAPGATSSVMVTNAENGSQVQTFANSASSKKALVSTGNLILVAQNDKPIIQAYKLHKSAIDQKMIVPEILLTMSISPDGVWLLGGAASGNIYMWELHSGNLLFTKPAHYQEVVISEFTRDGKTFITGSADGSIYVWRVLEILGRTNTQELVKPQFRLTAHTQAVTDCYIGAGTTSSARLYTSSLDHTIRVWNLSTGQLLSVFVLPDPVHCLTVDPGERNIYAGTESGMIQDIKLYQQDGVIQVTGRVGTLTTPNGTDGDVFVGHEQTVTALSLNLTSNLLFSGDLEGNVFHWNIMGKQMLRRLRPFQSPISSIYTLTIPTTWNSYSKHDNVLLSLKRVQSERDNDDHYIHITLSENSSFNHYQPPDDMVTDRAIHMTSRPACTSQHTKDNDANKLQIDLKNLQSSYDELQAKYRDLHRAYLASHI